MYSKYLLSVIALLALFGFSSAQTPYCCGSPTGGFHPDLFNCAIFCNEGCFVCDLNDFGVSCAGYYGYQYSCPGGGDDSDLDDLDIDVVSSCDESMVVVTDNGNSESGVDVTIVEDGSGDPVASGTTNSDGEFEFPGCPDGENSGLHVEIEASKSGFDDEVKIATLYDCSLCAPPVCPEGQQMVEGECVPIPCECGQLVGNQCVPYNCGSGQACAACDSGFTCVNNACQEDNECTTSLQCDNDQFCNIPPGQNGGSCKDLCPDGSDFCQCSQATDHVLVPTGWECGSEMGCPSCPTGQQCVNHECVGSDLSCPSTGVVGDEKTCDATDCPNCDYEVILPNGQKVTGKTDQDGNFNLPLNLEGTYKVTLFQNGVPVKTVEIKAFPQSQPEEPEKPTTTGGDPFSLLWLLILLLLVILGIVYWRSRQQKK